MHFYFFNHNETDDLIGTLNIEALQIGNGCEKESKDKEMKAPVFPFCAK